jgi:2-C-methyl-D-erythritol 4-phosphate cytidylyltransferase/2-C-methyl-D-erythritol 2,4-cyclodiphosphate synthase
LKAGFAEAARRDLDVTDEAALVELVGGSVTLFPGNEHNVKLTTPHDLALAEILARAGAAESRQIRTGIGYDVHRLVPGRKLTLGGVVIPFDRGLDGHSDADVLLHAICDALLGACAQGDIGQHFPPSDRAYQGISSVALLERVRSLVSGRSVSIVNLDATVVAEAPRIGPYSAQMRHLIADTLTIPVDSVSIKATTNEGLGFAGRQEGIAALAIATVRMPA